MADSDPPVREEEEEEALTLQEAVDRLDEDDDESDIMEAAAQRFNHVCSYPYGYMKQNVYVCIDCSVKRGVSAGVCAACALQCHADHEVLELWQKRHFRCDCGTSRFEVTQVCSFDPSSERFDSENSENVYNHNFEGKYCGCDQPYDEQATMRQCIACEDWWHESCLPPLVCDALQKRESAVLVCKNCVVRFPDLTLYAESLSAAPPTDASAERLVAPSVQTTAADPPTSADAAAAAASAAITGGSLAGRKRRADDMPAPLCAAAPVDPPPGPVLLAADWETRRCACDACRTRWSQWDAEPWEARAAALAPASPTAAPGPAPATGTAPSVLRAGTVGEAPHAAVQAVAAELPALRDLLGGLLGQAVARAQAAGRTVVTEDDIRALVAQLKRSRRAP